MIRRTTKTTAMAWAMIVTTAAVAAAQQRPLVTEDPETIGGGRLLIEAGMTPLKAIEAATANGPLTLGPQAPRSGVLADGYDADIIALDADPIADITIWGDPARVTHVWKSGVQVKG